MKFLPKFNKYARKKLGEIFDKAGIGVIENILKERWDEELWATTNMAFKLTIPADLLKGCCQYGTQDHLMSRLTTITISFNTELDLEYEEKKTVVVGEWIKASEIEFYDIWSLGCVDVLLRSSVAFACEDLTLGTMTQNVGLYKVGHLDPDERQVYDAGSDSYCSLEEGDWDVMVIKANN